MTNENLYEILGDINETHIKEAKEYNKIKRPVSLKWGAMVACLCLIVAAVSGIIPLLQHQNDTVPAPMITINSKNYFSPDMPVDELPAEYHYLRDLTAEEASNTKLEGCAIYIDPQDVYMSTIYIYQECGTPINETTVDNTKRQWAYVKWTISETE